MKRSASISDYLKPLVDTPNQAYLTNALQVADVLEWILQQVGKSKVWQTSFSISEEFLRRLFFIEKGGKVLEFNLVLDHKATNKTLKLWSFICQVMKRTYLADNHSQNLTRGNRHESTFISTYKAIFAALHGQVTDLIRNHSVPLNDLFAQRLTQNGAND